jgi:hypothetical protein
MVRPAEMVNPKTIQFLTLQLIAFAIGKILFLALGTPLSVFVAILSFYFVGYIALKFWYAIFTLDMILTAPFIYGFAQAVAQVNYIAQPEAAVLVNVNYVFVILLTMTYFSTILWFQTAKAILRKTRIINRLKPITKM